MQLHLRHVGQGAFNRGSKRNAESYRPHQPGQHKPLQLMFIDSTGHMPKWLQGTLNFVGGVAETAIGVGLGIAAGWTGFGAVAAAFLIADSAARATQWVVQIVNYIAGSTILPEEHIIKAAFQNVGYSI